MMSLENFTDIRSWAEAQWGGAQLGDSRRTKRAIAIGSAMAENPQGSLPDIMQGWNEIRAAYRLFAQEDVSHTALIQPHTMATKTTAYNQQAKIVLFVQDTTELDYTNQKQIKGLGHIGDGRGKGIMLHSCLAIVPTPGNPLVLGLAGQIPWVRGFDNNDENNYEQDITPELLRTDSEGDIWAEMVESIGSAPTPQTGLLWVSVGDRGSDIFSYLRRARSKNWQCLLRVTQNRVILKPDGTKGHLKAFARSLEPMAIKTIVLRGRNSQPKRDVHLQVAWSPLTIQPPATGCERIFSQLRVGAFVVGNLMVIWSGFCLLLCL